MVVPVVDKAVDATWAKPENFKDYFLSKGT